MSRNDDTNRHHLDYDLGQDHPGHVREVIRHYVNVEVVKRTGDHIITKGIGGGIMMTGTKGGALRIRRRMRM